MWVAIAILRPPVQLPARLESDQKGSAVDCDCDVRFEEKKAAEVRAKGGTARGLDGASKFGLDIVPTPADGEKNKVCA